MEHSEEFPTRSFTFMFGDKSVVVIVCWTKGGDIRITTEDIDESYVLPRIYKKYKDKHGRYQEHDALINIVSEYKDQYPTYRKGDWWTLPTKVLSAFRAAVYANALELPHDRYYDFARAILYRKGISDQQWYWACCDSRFKRVLLKRPWIPRDIKPDGDALRWYLGDMYEHYIELRGRMPKGYAPKDKYAARLLAHFNMHEGRLPQLTKMLCRVDRKQIDKSLRLWNRYLIEAHAIGAYYQAQKYDGRKIRKFYRYFSDIFDAVPDREYVSLVAFTKYSIRWHLNAAVRRRTESMVAKAIEGKNVRVDYPFNRTPACEGVAFTVISSTFDLIAEGEAMDHCCGTMADDLVLGHKVFFHADADDGSSATGHLCHYNSGGWQLGYARGPHNTRNKASVSLENALRQLLARAELVVTDVTAVVETENGTVSLQELLKAATDMMVANVNKLVD